MQGDDNLEFRIAKLEVKAGDMLVVKCDGYLSLEMSKKLKQQFKDRLPEGVQVLILDKGLDLAVLTFDEIQRRATLADAA